jgi:cell division septation protein DedD
MNLSVYISELLKTNDCVIIPDLGGFIANFQSARYEGQGDQFAPPAKEIIFSGKLKKNDGLLVNYVSEHEGVGYLEARKIVSEFVSEYLFKLENGETVEFEQIGTLRFDQNEHLLFEAGNYQIVRTDAFGLDAFHFPELVSKYHQSVKPVFRDKAPEPQLNRRPVVNREALKYLLIAIPVIALLYFLPVSKLLNFKHLENQQTPNTASLTISDAPASIKPEAKASEKEDTQDVYMSEPKLIVETEKVVPSKINQENIVAEAKVSESGPIHEVMPKSSQPVKPIAQTVVNEPSKGRYHVVGGCFKIRENADKLVQELTKQGYHAQVSNMGRSFFRVSVDTYQTRSEAEQTLKKLLTAEPDGGYWLMADKK